VREGSQLIIFFKMGFEIDGGRCLRRSFNACPSPIDKPLTVSHPEFTVGCTDKDILLASGEPMETN
jgi:hypothetical protein